MPLLDNGLAAVAVILLECESFVGSSYRVLQEHCTRAVDRRMEADPGSGGERAEISMARLSKMILVESLKGRIPPSIRSRSTKLGRR